MITRDSNNVCTVEMYDLINKQTNEKKYVQKECCIYE